MKSLILVFLFLGCYGTYYEKYSNLRNDLQIKMKDPKQFGETIVAKTETNTFYLFPTFHDLKLSTLELQSILHFLQTRDVDEVYLEVNEDLRNEYWKDISGLMLMYERSKFSEKMDYQIEKYLIENNIHPLALDNLDHLKVRPNDNRTTGELILHMYNHKNEINEILTHLKASPILQDLDKLNEDIEYFNEILKTTYPISTPQDLYQSLYGDLRQIFFTICDITTSEKVQNYMSDRNKEWFQKIRKTSGKKLIIAGGMHFSNSTFSLLQLLKNDHFEVEFDSIFSKTESFDSEKYITMATMLDSHLDNAFLNHYTV
jgi:hypothetical protein